MKQVSLLLLLFFLCQSSFGQPQQEDTTKGYGTADTAPVFPDQYGSVYEYIASRIVYPDAAKENNVEGKVVVRFVVEPDGDVSGAEVIQGIGAGCDSMALSVIRELPDWIPGKKDGKAVPAYVTLPIRFKLGNATLDKALKGLELDRDLTSDKTWTSSDGDSIELAPDQMPTFPGGRLEMLLYLTQNLRYPASARRAGIEGTVYVEFVVDDKGNVTDVKIRKGVSPACDKEAMRVIKNMPRWVPGKKDGKKVKVYYSLPIRFQLN